MTIPNNDIFSNTSTTAEIKYIPAKNNLKIGYLLKKIIRC